MASHPTKDSISTDAARPTDHQPSGANGVQFSTRACGAAPSTATATSTASSATRASCTPPRTARPASAMATTTASSTAASSTVAVGPPPIRSATYPAPIKHTTGAPSTTPARKHQPTTRAAPAPSRPGPKPARV